MEIRETSDAGTPLTALEPEGPVAEIYREIARKVWEQVGAGRGEGARQPPKITFE